MENKVKLNPNKLVRFLNKMPDQFTKADIINFIEANNIKMLNFRYVGGDGKLKTLNFVINSREHLEKLLTTGERVDGSSLFSYISASSSDLYVVPRYKTAFLNPFTAEPTLDLLCSYYDNAGQPLMSSPENLVRKAHQVFKEKTGMAMEALGELEYYLFSEIDQIYPIVAQKGYHESHPFSKWECIRLEAMKIISEIGGQIKYGHAEVGNIIYDGQEMVQHEIEFLPCPVDEMADQMVLAKWVMREVAYKYNLTVTFAPKIIVGHAGSGLHFHLRLVKDGINMMVDEKGLNDTAKKAIAGILMLAPSLTAFGNTVPTSFLRLVPHQEAPTSICWGDRNRSVLVRVPLGWIGADNMIYDANPNEPKSDKKFMSNQTFELRSPDGSANIHQLLAGITVAARYGLEHPDALKIAQDLYISMDASKRDDLKQLPATCYEAAEMLLKDRHIYEELDVFQPAMIDGVAKYLKSHQDNELSERMFGNVKGIQELVDKFMHCG